MNKEHMTTRKSGGSGRSERDEEIAHRARITAKLKEQRLKRDAELAAAGLPAQPPKRSPRQKSTPAG